MYLLIGTSIMAIEKAIRGRKNLRGLTLTPSRWFD